MVAILANPLMVTSLPEVLSDLGQPDDRAGFLVAVVPLPGVVIAPVAGILADRFGRRRVLLIAMVGFGLAGLASSVASSLVTLLVARFVQGIGSATLITVAVVLIADFWEADARTRVLGFHAAAVSIGLLVTPLISGLVTDFGSWRWSASIAVIALPLTAACHRLVPDNFSKSDLSVHQQLSTILRTLRRPGVTAALSVNLVFAAGAFGILLTAVPLYLDAEFGAGPGVRGAFLALSSLGGVAAGLGVARVRRAMNVRWTLTSAAGAMTACALVAGSTAVAVLMAVSVFSFGVASGLVNPTLQDFIASAVSPGQRAAGLAALVSTMRLGQAIGPLLTGLLLRPLDHSAVVLVAAGVLGGLTLAVSLDIVSTEKTE